MSNVYARMLVSFVSTLSLTWSMAATSETVNDILTIADFDTNNFTGLRFENDDYPDIGFCFRSGNLEFFVNDSCSPLNIAMLLDANGNLGIGETTPTQDLHITRGDSPTMRLEQSNSSGFAAQSWDVVGNETSFFIRDVTNGSTLPFRIQPGAASNSLIVQGDGNIGVGTLNPEGKLHTYGDGVQLSYFESGDGGPVQVRFRTDSQNRRFLAVNNANEVKSQLIFLDNRINFTGQTDSGANLWLSVGPDGIISQGPSCGSPCDGVFDPDVFEVPTIEAHAAQMWAQKHLPAIGPTKPNEPINMTEKVGGIIHELEVAHIYIEQLHERLEAQESVIAEQAEKFQAMEARLRALEEH